MTESKLAISVDIEDWYHSRHVNSTDRSPNSSVMEFKDRYNKNYNFLEQPLNTFLELYEKMDIKATFFIVADLVNDNNLKTFEKIVTAGHEIACHGLHHIEYTGNGSLKEVTLFRENISQSIKILSSFSLNPIVGFRAPSAFYRPWMTEVLLDHGIRYDSSISRNSLFNKFGQAIPAHIKTKPVYFHENEFPDRDIVELPWPFLNTLGFKIPTGGGPTIRYFPSLLNKLGIAQSLRKGDSSLYIHPHDICLEPLPEIIISNRKKFWRNRGNEALKRYKAILSRFEGRTCTCEEAYNRFRNNS